MDVAAGARWPGVNVMGGAMGVGLDATAAAVTHGDRDGAHAEADQHDRHRELEGGLDRRWHQRAGGDQDQADQHQGQGVAEAPDRTEERAAAGAAGVGHQRRHRRQVIGLEGMADTDHEAEQHAAEHREHRTDRSTSTDHLVVMSGSWLPAAK